ncbi:LysR family transcriptional regulator [Modestobacter sp. VKM Ac-2983]|uniref:LysR family transcriptional regulator n=1 Tax=Modestobacter sp. VKM Ac-2983 TaxID=3004137 RepID=UPI0022ABBEE6|nr:LysR family transcriptional regulator [Modestobacter sp. VKM Ac-2983]MCZ2804913.1 LysR family transcriptional regulator [Modestobacter sp. VKM Ac-2983]
MELRHLTYFARVAEAGSVSGAAAMLHMTQPSLSRQIADLERELGHRLFERTADGMVLTAAGRGLHEHVAVVFAQLERIPEVVRTFGAGQEIVRLGLPPGVPHEWFLAVIAALEASLPHVALSLVEASSDEQQNLLRNGLIDVGLLHVQPPDLGCAPVLTQELGVAVPPDSPLGDRPSIRFSDLDGRRVMAHASGEITSEEARLRSASAAAGVHTHWMFRRFSVHSELIAVSSKVEAALMTEASARRNLSGWRWVPFMERDATGRDLAVVTWAAWRPPARATTTTLVQVLGATPWSPG